LPPLRLAALQSLQNLLVTLDHIVVGLLELFFPFFLVQLAKDLVVEAVQTFLDLRDVIGERYTFITLCISKPHL
jgi:hypothetical protein